MSAADKLEFAEWLKVRDTVAGLINDKTTLLVAPSRTVAEDLISAGLIDLDFILRERPEPEVELDATPPTHEAYLDDVGAWVPVELVRVLGAKTSLVRPLDKAHGVGTERVTNDKVRAL